MGTSTAGRRSVAGAALHSGKRTCQRGQTKCHYDFPDRAAISLWHVLAESYLTRGDFSVLVLRLRVENICGALVCSPSATGQKNLAQRNGIRPTALWNDPVVSVIKFPFTSHLTCRKWGSPLCFVAPCFRLSPRNVSVVTMYTWIFGVALFHPHMPCKKHVIWQGGGCHRLSYDNLRLSNDMYITCNMTTWGSHMTTSTLSYDNLYLVILHVIKWHVILHVIGGCHGLTTPSCNWQWLVVAR